MGCLTKCQPDKQYYMLTAPYVKKRTINTIVFLDEDGVTENSVIDITKTNHYLITKVWSLDTTLGAVEIPNCNDLIIMCPAILIDAEIY